jgi:hypothetical protein
MDAVGAALKEAQIQLGQEAFALGGRPAELSAQATRIQGLLDGLAGVDGDLDIQRARNQGAKAGALRFGIFFLVAVLLLAGLTWGLFRLVPMLRG